MIGSCLLIGRVSAQDLKLNKTQIGKEITLAIPESFIPMSEQDIAQKYISYRDPLAVYTNSDRTVDFGVNLSVTHWKPEDLEILQDFFENSIRSLYTKVDFIRKDIEVINETPYAVFEFISTVAGEDNAINQSKPISKYHLIHYGVVNNKTVLFNFTAPASAKSEWENVAKEIMSSKKIKKTL